MGSQNEQQNDRHCHCVDQTECFDAQDDTGHSVSTHSIVKVAVSPVGTADQVENESSNKIPVLVRDMPSHDDGDPHHHQEQIDAKDVTEHGNGKRWRFILVHKMLPEKKDEGADCEK